LRSGERDGCAEGSQRYDYNESEELHHAILCLKCGTHLFLNSLSLHACVPSGLDTGYAGMATGGGRSKISTWIILYLADITALRAPNSEGSKEGRRICSSSASTHSSRHC
jgi:hypothetical protein